MDDFLRQFKEPLPPAGLVSSEVTSSGFTKRSFSERNKQRVKSKLGKRRYATKNVRPRKRQRSYTKKIFTEAEDRLLLEPKEIPDSNVFQLPEKIKTLSNGIPCNVIRTFNIPKEFLHHAPADVVQTLRSDLTVVETLDKSRLLELVKVLQIPSFLYSETSSKFQLISIIYELIDEEYFALWLTKLYQQENTYELTEGIFHGYRFAIYKPDFGEAFVTRIINKIEENGGIVDEQIDERIHFVIFKQTQKIDLSDLPHVRPLTHAQLEKLATMKLNENDALLDSMINKTPKEATEFYKETDSLLQPIFLPSKKFQQNQNLMTRDGIPLWKYESESDIHNGAKQNDIEKLEIELDKDLPESLKELWATQNGGKLRRSLWKDNHHRIFINYLAGVSDLYPYSVLCLYKELDNSQFVPLYKNNNSILALDYRIPSKDPPVVWIAHYKEINSIVQLGKNFGSFLDQLVDPSDKYVFGLMSYHETRIQPLQEYFAERFELYFQKTKQVYRATHFYWKNKETLKRCEFIIRTQQGYSEQSKFPYEYPEFQGVRWIIQVDPIHEYYLSILEDALASSPFEVKDKTHLHSSSTYLLLGRTDCITKLINGVNSLKISSFNTVFGSTERS